MLQPPGWSTAAVGAAARSRHSHRHPLLDMPPGIFKMINGSKYMTVPPDGAAGASRRAGPRHSAGQRPGRRHLGERPGLHARPTFGLSTSGTSCCAATMTAHAGTGRRAAHFRRMEGNNRLYDERHGADGPLLVSDPGHIDDVSRWFVQSVQALGVPFTPDFNGPRQRGVGFYQFMNRQRTALQRRLCVPRAAEGRSAPDGPPQRAGADGSRSRTAAPPASPGATPTAREHTARSRLGHHRDRGRARHAASS